LPFDVSVRERNTSVVEKDGERVPLPDGVGGGFAEGNEALVQIGDDTLQLVHDGLTQLAP